MEFLDNVLQYFIDHAPDTIARARLSAMRERSVGLGAMGFHAYLQKNGIAFESVVAKVTNMAMFRHIRNECERADKVLCEKRGACRANVFRQDTISGAHIVKNRFLKRVLAELGLDTDEVWSDLIAHDGSVQHRTDLPQQVRDVFKTAQEIDLLLPQ